MNRTLTRWERVQLRVHVTLCSACRRYRRQIQLISELLHKHGSLLEDDPAFDTAMMGLSPEAKLRIRAALRDAL